MPGTVPYRPGRSRSWIRAKHWTVTTLPVCGYTTTPAGTPGALFVRCIDGPAKVELGLHGESAHGLAALLPSLKGHKGRDVTWVDPVVQVLIRHHGKSAQPRDAHLVGLA